MLMGMMADAKISVQPPQSKTKQNLHKQNKENLHQGNTLKPNYARLSNTLISDEQQFLLTNSRSSFEQVE
jgi:cAMP phosphodiesterase